jgi:hypothetical protein
MVSIPPFLVVRSIVVELPRGDEAALSVVADWPSFLMITRVE